MGAGDNGAAAKIGVEALLLALALGAVVTAVGLLLYRAIVASLDAAGSVTEPAGDYLRIMYVTLAGTTLNLVLDYLFLFVLASGSPGRRGRT